MKGLCEKLSILIFLFGGFWAFYAWIRQQEFVSRFMKKTKKQMDINEKQRLLDERALVLEGVTDDTIWQKLEKILFYSGLKWRYPFLSVERWIVMQICAVGAAVIAGTVVFGKRGALILPAGFLIAELFFMKLARGELNQKVNDNLPKFLDFLGNYSMTSGELAAIFEQTAKYMESPLSDALEECSHEAALTGDMSTALLCMREKIEHPQFKAIVNELEINMRYCADYAVLVQSSRRSLRDYLKASGERRGMLREAVVNASLLLFMSGISMFAVNALIDESVWDILTGTMPGKLSLSMMAGILILFLGKVSRNGG